MTGRFHDTSCPGQGTTTLDNPFVAGVPPHDLDTASSDGPIAVDDAQWDAIVAGLLERVAATESVDANIAKLNSEQRGRSWTLPVPECDDVAPVWLSADDWKASLRRSLNSTAGRTVCSTHQVGTEAVFACGVMMMLSADHSTGRRVSIAVDTLAERTGLSRSTIKRARRVLRDLGFAVERVRGRYLSHLERVAARAHHGGHQRRAASVWDLRTPRRVARPFVRRQQGYPQSVRRGPLPPLGGVCSSSLLERNSLTRAPAARTRKLSRCTTQQRPRPIAAQVVAAELVLRAPSLGRVHIGQIVDVIARSGVDLDRVTGAAIATALTRDGMRRGLTWPDRIDKPAPFLRYRLSLLDPADLADTTRDGSSARRHARRADFDQPMRYTAPAASEVPAASGAHRAASRQLAADLIAARRAAGTDRTAS